MNYLRLAEWSGPSHRRLFRAATQPSSENQRGLEFALGRGKLQRSTLRLRLMAGDLVVRAPLEQGWRQQSGLFDLAPLASAPRQSLSTLQQPGLFAVLAPIELLVD